MTALIKSPKLIYYKFELPNTEKMERASVWLHGIEKVYTTWREPKHDPRAIIALSHDPKVSDLVLYLGYELKEYEDKYWDYLGTHPPILINDARKMYKPNDRIKLCLKFVPVECRKFVPDFRGEIYSITNERTRKTHFGRYGKNYCGGA